MRRKKSTATLSASAGSTKALPVKQLKSMRAFGIKQLAAAMEMVGVGEHFIDRQLAIGLALKLSRQPLSSVERGELVMDGAEYLLERGLLELEPPPRPKHGDVEVIIRVPSVEAFIVEELIQAGLKPRSLGMDTGVTEFKGRLPRDSDLLRRVHKAQGTVAFIENPHPPDKVVSRSGTENISHEVKLPEISADGDRAAEPKLPSARDSDGQVSVQLEPTAPAEEPFVTIRVDKPSAIKQRDAKNEQASEAAVKVRLGTEGPSQQVLDQLTALAIRLGRRNAQSQREMKNADRI